MNEELYNDRIIEEVYSHEISYNNVKKINNTNNLYYFCKELTPEDINKISESFGQNSGICNDGIKRSIPETKKFLKIYIPNLELKVFDYMNNNIYPATKWVESNLDYVDIFANSKKVPLEKLYYFSSNHGVDIFINDDYYSMKENVTIDVEFKLNNSLVINKLEENYSGSMIELDYSSNPFISKEKDNIEKDNILLFKNDLFNRDFSFNNDTTNKKLIITLMNNIEASNIEIYLDLNIFKIYKEIYNEEKSYVNFNIPEEIHYYEDGSIPFKRSLFFINEKSISKNKILKNSRFSFQNNFSSPITINETFLVIYKNNNSKENIWETFGSDYYLTNMLGVDRAIDGSNGLITNSIFDTIRYFEYNKVLNGDGSFFNHKKTIDELKYKYLNNVSRKEGMKRLIFDYPHLLRYYLNNFKNYNRYYTIYRNDIVPGTDFKFLGIENQTNETANKTLYRVQLNGKVLSSNEYYIELDGKNEFIYIDEILFLEQPINYVDITVYENKYSYREYKIMNIDQFTPVSGLPYKYYARLPKSFLGDWLNPVNNYSNDLKILEYSINSSTIKYPDGSDNGYIFIEQLIVDEDEENFVIYLMREPTQSKLLLVNRNFSNSISYVETRDYSDIIENGEDATTISLSSSTLDGHIPFIHNTLADPLVYRNGILLRNNIDYTVTNQLDSKNLGCSFLNLSAIPIINDTYEVFFTGSSASSIISYNGININNKYGLVYLSELDFPVSLDYLDIYVNGVKQYKEDCDILSEKLIRFRKATVPIVSLEIYLNLNIQLSIIEEVMNMYKIDDFELTIEEIFKKANPSILTYPEETPDIDDVYAGFDENVDGNKKFPNETNDLSSANNNLVVEYFLDYLRSGNTAHYLFEGELLKKAVSEYFEQFPNEYKDENGYDIIINNSSPIAFSDNDYIIDDKERYIMDPSMREFGAWTHFIRFCIDYTTTNYYTDIESLWDLYKNDDKSSVEMHPHSYSQNGINGQDSLGTVDTEILGEDSDVIIS